jgi:hypothetical protein
MCNVKVQHQRHWVCHFHEVVNQLNDPTVLTPVSSHLLLRFYCMCCAKEVSELINRPVVDLLGTRVGSTSAQVVYMFIMNQENES